MKENKDKALIYLDKIEMIFKDLESECKMISKRLGSDCNNLRMKIILLKVKIQEYEEIEKLSKEEKKKQFLEEIEKDNKKIMEESSN